MIAEPMTARIAASILVVEDDPQQIRVYARALPDCRLTCVANGTAALKALGEATPDLILLDHVLAGGEKGTDFLPRLKGAVAHVPIIVVSGSLDIRGQIKALQGPRSAHYVIEKPIDLDELETTIETALSECGIAEAIRSLESMERAELVDRNEPERRFVERLSRQHQILKRLRGSPERPNVSALAREFSVARRTIQRDLQDLIRRGQLEEASFPDLNED
jgi:DNA-binding NtrC family response regulator